MPREKNLTCDSARHSQLAAVLTVPLSLFQSLSHSLSLSLSPETLFSLLPFVTSLAIVLTWKTSSDAAPLFFFLSVFFFFLPAASVERRRDLSHGVEKEKKRKKEEAASAWQLGGGEALRSELQALQHSCG